MPTWLMLIFIAFKSTLFAYLTSDNGLFFFLIIHREIEGEKSRKFKKTLSPARASLL